MAWIAVRELPLAHFQRAKSVSGQPPERRLDDPEEPRGLQPVRRQHGRPSPARPGLLLFHIRGLSRIHFPARVRERSDREAEKRHYASPAVSRIEDPARHLAVADLADHQGWRLA